MPPLQIDPLDRPARSADPTTAQPDPARETPSMRRRSRILLVTSLYPTTDRPEVGAFVARRVRALRRRGVDVVVVASPSYRGSALRRHLALLRDALRRHGRVDGVEGHVAFPAGAIAVLAGRLRRRPVLLYAHGSDVAVPVARGGVYRAMAAVTIRLADRVVTNSAATAALVGRLGRSALAIPPGVDLEEFLPGERTPVRRRLGLPADALVALYVGALIPRKGADVFAAALDGAEGWLGVMVGRGELEARIAAEHPNVRLIGSVAPSAVAEWMRAADAVVVPSRDEPLGIAAIEALACGVPVVASAVGGLGEVVRDGVNGLLVPPDEPAAIRAALVRLRDDALRGSLAASARASVADHDLGRIAERMAEVWASLGVTA